MAFWVIILDDLSGPDTVTRVLIRKGRRQRRQWGRGHVVVTERFEGARLLAGFGDGRRSHVPRNAGSL